MVHVITQLHVIEILDSLHNKQQLNGMLKTSFLSIKFFISGRGFTRTNIFLYGNQIISPLTRNFLTSSYPLSNSFTGSSKALGTVDSKTRNSLFHFVLRTLSVWNDLVELLMFKTLW